MHHTNKPPKESKAKAGWTNSDWSYEGAGSSDLTNWARAIMVLKREDEETFELKLAKRGRRAGARDPLNNRTNSVWIRHGQRGICWEQGAEPFEEKSAEPKNDRTKHSRNQRVSFDYDAFLETLANEHFNTSQLVERVCKFSNISARTAWAKILPELKRRMTFDTAFRTYSIT